MTASIRKTSCGKLRQENRLCGNPGSRVCGLRPYAGKRGAHRCIICALRTLPAELGVASDGVQQSVMLKYALTAGMVSQGVDVQDMGLCAPSAFAYAVRMLGLDGGIYIRRGETGKYEAELLLLDAMGASLSAGEHRKFRQQYELGAQRPVTASRLGVVQRYTGRGARL